MIAHLRNGPLRLLRLLAVLMVAGSLAAQEASPELAVLRDLERRIESVRDDVLDATVVIKTRRSTGSGVIVSADGLVLTAAHVFDRPGQRLRVVLRDGRELTAEGLGRHERDDYGMIRITGGEKDEKFKALSLGRSKGLQRGALCLAAGHPGGLDAQRWAPLRLGHLRRVGRGGGWRGEGPYLQTDATIDSGDSGGPLVDLTGKVIGIHSRIQSSDRSNFHVPIDLYRDHWEALVAGQELGQRPVLGLTLEESPGPGVGIERVEPDLPIHKAGVKATDRLLSIDGRRVASIDDVIEILEGHEVKDVVTLGLRRDGKDIEIKTELAARRR